MASRTIRAPLDFIGFHQLQPFLPLIGLWLPFHVENLIARPNETFGLTMAFHTPLHVKRRDLPGERHLIDAPVAGGAADPFLHMDAVIEVNKFRKIMDTVPCQWFARAADFRGRVRASDCLPRFGCGSSCKFLWKECLQKVRFPPTCGSNGNQSPGRQRGVDG